MNDHLTQILLALVVLQLQRLLPPLRAQLAGAVEIVRNGRKLTALLDHFRIAMPADSSPPSSPPAQASAPAGRDVVA